MAVMTSDADTVALLERALDQTAGLIAAIEPHQAGLATPCAGWDVRALVSHLAGRDLRNFLVAARGETPDWTAPDEEIGDDWAAAFGDRAGPLRAAWRAACPGRSGGGGAAGAGGRGVAAGTGEPAGLTPDMDGDAVAAAAGTSRAGLRQAADRGRAVTAMGRGAASVVADLVARGRVGGVLSAGGSGGSSIAAQGLAGAAGGGAPRRRVPLAPGAGAPAAGGPGGFLPLSA